MKPIIQMDRLAERILALVLAALFTAIWCCAPQASAQTCHIDISMNIYPSAPPHIGPPTATWSSTGGSTTNIPMVAACSGVYVELFGGSCPAPIGAICTLTTTPPPKGTNGYVNFAMDEIFVTNSADPDHIFTNSYYYLHDFNAPGGAMTLTLLGTVLGTCEAHRVSRPATAPPDRSM